MGKVIWKPEPTASLSEFAAADGMVPNLGPGTQMGKLDVKCTFCSCPSSPGRLAFAGLFHIAI